MEVRRTVPVTLEVDSQDAALLEDTVDQFLWAAQYVTDHAFHGEYVTPSKTTLNEETYADVREARLLTATRITSNRPATRLPKRVKALSNAGSKQRKRPNHTSGVHISCTSLEQPRSTTST
jgi:hypothetical protein